MEKSPLVSIVMPCYNAGNYLRASMEAVLQQSFTNFEFIVVNDGSTDETREIVLSMADPRIRFFEYQKNSGIVKALNLGLSVAQGKYILRTDADDIALPHMANDLVNFMEENPDYVVCGADMQLMGSDKIFEYPVEDDALKVLTLSACPFSHSTVIIRRQVLNINGISYDDLFRDAEDFALWSVLLPLGKFHNLGKVTLHYRESAGQVTAGKKYEGHRQDSLKRIFQFQAKTYFNLVDDQIDVYISLIIGNAPASWIELKRMANVLIVILERNRKNRLFRSDTLKQFFFVKWFSACERCPDNNFSIFLVSFRYVLVTGSPFKIIHILRLFVSRLLLTS